MLASASEDAHRVVVVRVMPDQTEPLRSDLNPAASACEVQIQSTRPAVKVGCKEEILYFKC